MSESAGCQRELGDWMACAGWVLLGCLGSLTWVQPVAAQLPGAGYALMFDGVDDYVTVAPDPTLGAINNFELFIRLNTAFSSASTSHLGLFDKGEYKLWLDARDGRLRFRQNARGEFQQRFGTGFLSGNVRAITSFDPDGAGPRPVTVYIADDLASARISNITRLFAWDGALVRELPSIVGQVNALAGFDTDGAGPDPIQLYAGGGFTASLGGFARLLNEEFWVRNGSGLTYTGTGVHTMAVHDDDGPAGAPPALILAGDFTSAGGVSGTARIAKWTGSGFVAMASGLNGVVSALTVHTDAAGTNLYAGGEFRAAVGGATLNGIGRWNGSTWQSLGTGVPAGQAVRALVSHNESGTLRLFAGGGFLTMNGVAAPGLARWNGTAWSAVGSGTQPGVSALASQGGQLYAGGSFSSMGGVSGACRMARWSGTAWSALGGGIAATEFESDTVTTLHGTTNDLLVGGTFETVGTGSCSGVGNQTLRRLALWNGSFWREVVGGLPVGSAAWVQAMRDWNNDLYVGGSFSSINGFSAVNIARYNGGRWQALGAGVPGVVYAMTVYQGDLVVGGGFNFVRRWNGTSWSNLGANFSSASQPVRALHVHDDGSGLKLYAGGGFLDAGGDAAADRIARWDGSAWRAVGPSGASQTVYALATYDGKLYAGGRFTSIGGASTSWRRLAAWNGSVWQPLPGDFAGSQGGHQVRALQVFDNTLIVGYGHDSLASGSISRFDGASWLPMPAGVNDEVLAFAVYNHELYASGKFTVTTGSTAARAAKWNGNTWTALEQGLNNEVAALAVFDGALYLGGRFTTAGLLGSAGLAAWFQRAGEIASTRTSWAANTMYHIALTTDGSDSALFVNGVQNASSFDLPDWSTAERTHAPLWIGCTAVTPIHGDSGKFFNGVLDELRLYEDSVWGDFLDRICTRLTPSDHASHWSVLQAYYRFDEGGGGVTEDLSDNNNAASLLGGPTWVTSRAPLGDAAVWTSTPTSGSALELSSALGDSLRLEFTSTASGYVALIRVDAGPNCIDPGTNMFQVFGRHYYEYWSPDVSPGHRAVYRYAGHPDAGDESNLAIANRTTALCPTEGGAAWSRLGTPVRDPVADTITVTGLSADRQFILGREGRNLTMAASPSGGGVTTPPAGVYRLPLGSAVDLSAFPNSGFRFSNWTVSTGSPVAPDPQCNAYGTVVVDNNKTATAVFASSPVINSTWLGGVVCPGGAPSECWSLRENWCPPIVPDNGPSYEFNVTLNAPAIVTLNTSPTIRSLTLNSGAELLVNSAIGASVPARAVIATLPIQNNGGLLAARDGKRLLLDAADIVQSSAGVLQAAGAGSVIEINGRSVTGGRTEVLAGGVIRLLGGGVLNNVRVNGALTARGAVVPNGQSGMLSGNIVNSTILSVGEVAPGGGERPAALLPDELCVLDGMGKVQLETVGARIGDFFGLVINGAQHTIQGAGVVFGAIENDGGTIAATTAGQELLLLPFPALDHDGLLTAEDGGTLRIAGDVATGATGGGRIHARGGRIIVDKVVVVSSELDVIPGFAAPGEIRIQGGSDVVAIKGVSVGGGQVSVVSGSHVTAGGPLVLSAAPGGEGDLIIGSTSSVSATSFSATADSDLEVAGELTVRDAFHFDATDESRFRMLAGSRLRITGGVGLPDTDPTGYATLEVGGLDLGLNPAAHIGAPLGFVDNFHLETLVIGPGAHVVLVDQRDNGNRGGPFATPAGNEALYTRTLRFEDGAGRLNLNGLHLYYETLIAPGGTGQLRDGTGPSFARGDLNCDGAVNFDDIAPFTQALVSRVSYQAAYPNCDYDLADVNCDGNVDFADIDGFVQCLTASRCPDCP